MRGPATGLGKLSGVTSLVAAALLAGCAGPTFAGKRLPSLEEPVVLPLLHPLTQHEVEFLATVEGPGGTRREPFILETQRHRSALSEGAAEALGLSPSGSRFNGFIYRTGDREEWRGVRVPKVLLADLVLQDLPMGLAGRSVLADEYLQQFAFTVDHDRGVLTLGGPPLPEAGRVDVGYQAAGAGHRLVEVRLDGAPVDMEVAVSGRSELDQDVGRELGLRVHWYKRPWRSGSWVGRGEFVAASVAVGPASQSQVTLSPLLHRTWWGLFNQPWVGYLGWGFWAPWIYRLDPETETISLRPRSDVVSTAVGRVARWKDLPRCEDAPACLTPRLQALGQDEGYVLEVANGGTDPLPWEAWVLVGFVDEAGRLVRDMGLLHLAWRRHASPHRTTHVLKLGALQRAWVVSGTVRPVVLDVNPAVDADWKCPPAKEGDSGGGSEQAYGCSRSSHWLGRLDRVHRGPGEADPAAAVGADTAP